MAVTDALMCWVQSSFPDLDWEDSETRMGAFHDVVISPAGQVARIVHGVGHGSRAAREIGIAEELVGINLGVQVPMLMTGSVADEQRTGYVVSLVPGTHESPMDWADLGDSYTALLARFTAVPTDELQLPPRRAWCGGEHFVEIVTTRLMPLLGDLASAAMNAVEALFGLSEPISPVFVHGDFGHHNILWHSARPLSLIDFDHACIDDQAIDVAPLIGAYGAVQVADTLPQDLVCRAMVHRATLSLQVAAAADLAGNTSLRDHALTNFTSRHTAGTLHDPGGESP